jgi:hypothetical protein
VASDFGVTASQTPGTRNRASRWIRGGSQPLIPFEVKHRHFGISGFGIPGILMTRNRDLSIENPEVAKRDVPLV